MNKQDVFNKVYKHLLTQNEKSVSITGACLYRGLNGTKCAIGCLIDDKYYSRSLEMTDVNSRFVQSALQSSGVDLNEKDIISFLFKLQYTHDHRNISEWKERLQDLAFEEKLTVPEL